ncbi:hypothetical protein NIES267_71530 (plasmid) [Calothrix parasitica NIES-267]|uniref:Uncharacterized protein n=1 Tax=Calothrix parasitica NIES-267 TaxID=1973488 RepID=A0A1Z4M2B6_9CYAN|nr:hypothetical protein NIES267_71530 [Calothrix parasitica NIES-267]
MGAPAYDYHDSSSKRLLPKDALGRRFIQYFYHGWSFIEALVPEWGERPSWRTEKRYPMEPRNIWSKYQDPELLLGLSFDKYTNYFVLDIDRKSRNHPENSRENFKGILHALEDIGMVRAVVVNSSESEGIHLYYFMPYPVYSIALAVAVKQTLFQAGFRLKSGQLEIFPNPKHYNPDKKTSFRSHRLPLQKNSFLLDWDLQPISNSVETLLDWADLTASSQDMESLGEALKAAQEWLSAQYYLRRGKNSAEQWCWDLEETIEQGWTGSGQTNDMLLALAKYGIIFKHHLGEELVEYMLSTALSSSGYTEFCNHQHEIEKRVRERARSAENYPYYPYRGEPPRPRTYKEQFGKDGVDNVIQLHPSKERHLITIERIRAVIAMLKSEGAFPETAYKRTQAIIKKSKAAYGKGVSQTTLHKKEYLPLWHPGYENREDVNTDKGVEKYSILPDPWDTASEERKSAPERVWESLQVVDLLDKAGVKPEPLQGEAFKRLHVTSYYEGLCLPPACQVGGLGESVSDDEVQPQAADLRGAAASSSESEIIGFNNQQPQEKAWSSGEQVIFLYLLIFQILSTGEITDLKFLIFLTEKLQSESDFEIKAILQIITNLKNQDLEIIFIYILISGIFSITEIINFNYFNFLIEIIYSQCSFEQFNDKKNLSASSGGSTPKNDKHKLSIIKTGSSPDTENTDKSSHPAYKTSREADNLEEGKNHSSVPSSSSQTPQEESSNSLLLENVSQTSTTVEHFSENNNCQRIGFTPDEYIKAIHFKLAAQKKAKEYHQEFFALKNIRLMPQQKQDYENVIKYYLMLFSSHNPAKQEAILWFAHHQELVTNARELGLWDYLEQLPPPDF